MDGPLVGLSAFFLMTGLGLWVVGEEVTVPFPPHHTEGLSYQCDFLKKKKKKKINHWNFLKSLY